MTTMMPVERAVERVVQVLQQEPAGLFTDIDGTISQVARVPSEAFVADSPKASLRSLATSVSIVGAITGRGAAEAATMLGLDGVVVVGNHGYERLHNGERLIHPSALGSRASVATTADLLLGIVQATPQLAGVVIENKDLSASVHYRLVEDQGRPVELLRQLVGAIAELHELHVTQGKLVYEIRPQALVNKGTALHDIAVELGLSGVVYLGDDVTDADAFLALKTLESPRVRTLSVGIVSSETHAVVRESADLLIEGVDGCVELLARVAEQLAPQR
ncbi:MAG: trehalose-phosphatase [Thermomicrobiales bacterium]|nr:MAG: trehalose-phosphatase [Thermomicrobiales bacterium]